MNDRKFLISLFLLGAALVCLPILGIKAFYLQKERIQQLVFAENYSRAVVLGTECDTKERSDIDCSGKIDLVDFSYWLENYKKTFSGEECQTDDDCKWCGSDCVSNDYQGDCLTVMPAPGQKCSCIKKNCTRCVTEGGKIVSSNEKCCSGLTKKDDLWPSENGVCIGLRMKSWRCLKCGDGVCGLSENKCNCPEDCVSGDECNTDIDCDDNNSCNTDTCVNKHCSHSNLTDGTSCKTNGKTGTCQSGVCILDSPRRPTPIWETKCVKKGGKCNSSKDCCYGLKCLPLSMKVPVEGFESKKQGVCVDRW